MKLLLDEMYPPRLAAALRLAGIEAGTAAEFHVAGGSDPELFALAVTEGCTILTENVADFTRISADHLGAGLHHSGLLIAISSRFSRRPAGTGPLVAAVATVAGQNLRDRVVFLESA